MSRRTGITLVEVLVAIFVMAIGLLALLTLFPLGALSMAQAIKDDRTGHCANNATAIASIWNVRFSGKPWEPLPPLNLPPLVDPPANQYADGAPEGYPRLVAGPGFPVYVDPFGRAAVYDDTVGRIDPLATHTPQPQWPAWGFPRVEFKPDPAAPAPPPWLPWFHLFDDINFEANGVPYPGDPTGGNSIERDYRYSWAFLVKLDDVTSAANPPPRPPLVDLTIVVYSGRPNLRSEKAYSALFDKAANTITLQWLGGDKPSVRRGSWILDATLPDPTQLPGVINTPPQGYFYRVVNVVSDTPPSLVLEMQTWPFPLRRTGPGVAVMMEGVVEVFERDKVERQ